MSTLALRTRGALGPLRTRGALGPLRTRGALEPLRTRGALEPLRTRGAWDVDRWVRDFFGPTADDWFARFNPAAEVVRDGDDAVVRVELPGVDVEKDVNVEVQRGQLVIHGERRDERAEEADGRTLRDVRYGSFRRSFQLPAHVTSESVSASYDAGVLTVRVAGAHKGADAQRIAIESK